MLSFIKKMFFWSYGRSTWQYDVLCALILVFIFLTPKGWFESGERAHWAKHQKASTAVTRLLIEPDKVSMKSGTPDLERRVQELTGRADARIKEARPVKNDAGQIVAYEVDIE